MAKGYCGAASQAELLKAQGNQLFAREKLGPAIDAYTEAIALCPTVPVYWTNRALCFRKRKEWANVESDCKMALKLDRESVKAHYMLGLAYLQNKHFDDAIRELEKALELARGGKVGPDMVEEIWQELAKAKYTHWQVEAAERREAQARLREYVKGLMKADYEQQRERILKAGGADLSNHRSNGDAQQDAAGTASPASEAGGGGGIRGSSKEGGVERNEATPMDEDREEDRKERGQPGGTRETQAEDSGPERESEGQGGGMGGADGADDGGKGDEEKQRRELLAQLDELYQERINTLENVCEKAGAPDRPGEVPDHLCCQITMDVFRDPVITPSGISYERSVLMDHLKKGRKFDPVSRAPLEPDQVYPNLALREAVQSFLHDYGWAYSMGR